MQTTQEHYEKHLAPVYAWMVGGIDSAIARGSQELADIGLLDGNAHYAVDLGAGFGMHAIPLATNGCRVLAVDSSSHLLNELDARKGDVPVTTIQDDLVSFAKHLSGAPDIILCMGDTLTHLPDVSAVESLISSAGEHLDGGGRFVLSFRDYSQALQGLQRFIPVRSDDSRIFTCFLEYADDRVQVHDIIHERTGSVWDMKVSAYWKLRLDPAWVKQRLEDHGFVVTLGPGMSGMVRIIAVRSTPPL